jgi:signal transduction histidine kinase
MPEASSSPGWRDSLSVRLLAITIGVILFVELLIFIPSAINFRDNWLDERLQAARIAVLSLEAAPSRQVSDELSVELLKNAEVLSVMKIGQDRRELVLAPLEPIAGETVIIHRSTENWFQRFRHTLHLLWPGKTFLMRVDSAADAEEATLEVFIPELPLIADIRSFSGRILILSLIISIVAGGLVFLVLDYLVVRPMRNVTASIIKFRDNPGVSIQKPPPSNRKDEVGRAQQALADMETVVSDAFRQRERLAQLGEAVAKINHDLRNSLSAAQLVSDGLARSEDPRVQRAAPRLERALERAINLAQETLQYGKTEPSKAKLQPTQIKEAVTEAVAEALARFPEIKFSEQIDEGVTHDVDPDHLHRIVSNLVRNAATATSTVRPNDGLITVSLSGKTLIIEDNGPGLPKKTRDNLFVPFANSTSKGGTGLGLVIARELSQAMGGDLKLGATGEAGTAFHVILP